MPSRAEALEEVEAAAALLATQLAQRVSHCAEIPDKKEADRCAGVDMATDKAGLGDKYDKQISEQVDKQMQGGKK